VAQRRLGFVLFPKPGGAPWLQVVLLGERSNDWLILAQEHRARAQFKRGVKSALSPFDGPQQVLQRTIWYWWE